MYNAFISYSHTADDKFAPYLQDALQKFAKPWYKKRNLEVFRDESSLSASPHLWNNITHALDQSEYLVLLASPASENSKWVNKEIEYWLEHKSIDNILIALTDGKLEWNDENKCFLDADVNSLPPALDNKFDSEPFYIDLRFSRTEKDLSLDNPIFKKEVLKLAAKLHGKQPNDLASEEVTVHRKMIRLRDSVIATLIILLIGAVVAAIFANKESIEATRQKRIAISQRDTARGNFVISEAKSMLEKDPTLALRMTEAALKFYKGDRIINAGDKIYKGNYFYKTLLAPDTANSLRYFKKIIFSRNGEFVLAGLNNNDMILWKLTGDKLDSVQYFRGNKGRLRRADFSADDKWLLTGSQDSEARIWSIATGTAVKTFKSSGPVTNVEFQPKGNFIATRSESPDGGVEDATATIWDTISGKALFNIPVPEPVGITFSPDGKLILTHHQDGRSYLWSITNNPAGVKQQNQFTSNWDEGSAITGSFSTDGKKIAIGYYGRVVRLYNLDGKPISTQVQNKGISKICFPPADVNGLYSPFSEPGLSGSFITGTYDGIISLWNYSGDDIKNIKTELVWALKILIDEKYWVTDIVELKNGNILAAYSDGKVRLWDMNKDPGSIPWQEYLKSDKIDTLPAEIKKTIRP